MCAALLTFVCMLRYSEWNVMPIWFLYSSIFIVVRCADLVSGFSDIYSGTLSRSRFWILRYLQWYTASIWFRGFFGIYRNILYRSNISGQDAQSASVTCSVFFLSAGSVSQRKVASPSPSTHKTSTASTTASTPGPMPPSSGVPLSIPHTDRFHLSLASLYISNKTKNPRRPANTTLPDTREKRTNVKRIFTIHFATCP